MLLLMHLLLGFVINARAGISGYLPLVQQQYWHLPTVRKIGLPLVLQCSLSTISGEHISGLLSPSYLDTLLLNEEAHFELV